MAVTLVPLKQARSLLKTGEIMHNSATSFWTYSSHFMHWIQYNNLILKHFITGYSNLILKHFITGYNIIIWYWNIFLFYMSICWAPFLKISPKRFTMVTVPLVSASEQTHCALVLCDRMTWHLLFLLSWGKTHSLLLFNHNLRQW